MKSEHPRYAGAIEIHIEQPNLGTLPGKGQSEIDGRHALTDPALAAHHHELMLNAGHAGVDLLGLLGNLLDDFGVVRILQFSEDRLQILLRRHILPLWWIE